MELSEVMRTTFSARDFTDDPLPDEEIHRILDDARFASSGGNRQGWRVIVVRDRATRELLVELMKVPTQRYVAQSKAGENPWNAVHPTSVDADAIASARVPDHLARPILEAPVVLLVLVDLGVVASMDQDLDRIGVASGASVYPFAWNILLRARAAGYGGTLTTLAVAGEPALQTHLGIPSEFALAAVMPMGRPVKQLTRLKRKAVSEFTMLERWNGAPLEAR